MTDEQLWEFQLMYENPDLSVGEIAEHFNVSKRYIYHLAYRNEIKRGYYKDEDSKKCPHCGLVLPIHEFHRNRAGRRGLCSWCKECEKSRHRQIYSRRNIDE